MILRILQQKNISHNDINPNIKFKIDPYNSYNCIEYLHMPKIKYRSEEWTKF